MSDDSGSDTDSLSETIEAVEPNEAIEIVDEKNDTEDIVYEKIITGDNRRTSNIMTLTVYCSIISVRAAHIASGAPIFIDVGSLTKPDLIAREEIRQGKCPLKIRVPLGDAFEEWKINEMTLPPGIN